MFTEYEVTTLLKRLGEFGVDRSMNDFEGSTWDSVIRKLRAFQTKDYISRDAHTVVLDDLIRMREYAMTLENGRRDLWGVNEELRDKIAALEKGQLDLLESLKAAQDRIANYYREKIRGQDIQE